MVQMAKNLLGKLKCSKCCALMKQVKTGVLASNEWLLNRPKKPSVPFLSTLSSSFGNRPAVPLLEHIVTPVTFLLTLWILTLTSMSLCIFRMARQHGLRGKRDAVLLLVVLTALCYHLTWGVYHWQGLWWGRGLGAFLSARRWI